MANCFFSFFFHNQRFLSPFNSVPTSNFILNSTFIQYLYTSTNIK
uniref:Uncharacterized protein n=1 Tax=Rhizophora mucronata TaxID=61149 RepID=A0A2P2QC75_RHIMU